MNGEPVTLQALARATRKTVWNVKLHALACGVPIDLARRRQWLDEVQAAMILNALQFTGSGSLYGKTAAVAEVLGVSEPTVLKTAARLGLRPTSLRHPVLKFPIHFWTRRQMRRIAAACGKINRLTTTQPIAARGSSPRKASKANRPRVWRSRHRHTRNFPSRHDDDTD